MVFLEKIFGKRSPSVDNDFGYEKTELEKLLLRRILELRVDEAIVIENVLPSKDIKQEIKEASSRDKEKSTQDIMFDAYDRYPYLMAIYELSEGFRYNARYKEIMSRESFVALSVKYVGRKLRDFIKDDVVQNKIKLNIKELQKKRKLYYKDRDHTLENLGKIDKYISAYEELLVKK